MSTSSNSFRAEVKNTPSRILYPTMITAHAGAEDTQANTVESLKVILACGADCIEVDLRKTEDILYLSHEALTPGQPYTTLQEAFELLAIFPDMMMNIDVKTSGLIQDILTLARAHGIASRLIITGDVGPDDLDIIRHSEIPLWMNNYILPLLEWGDPVKAAEKRGFSIVNIDKRRLTDKMLREQADRFSVWTVNDEETLRRLLEAKVKNITTRQPRLAVRLRSEIQQPNTK